MSMVLPKLGLRQRVFQAGAWTAAGYGASQLLRFGSNLIMTRLLFPEAFGLMAIVQSVLIGVTMLSDMAASQSVIRSRSGANPTFLNTAWTIQILQGTLVSLVLLIGAGPIAAHFGQPMLADLLRVAALIALTAAFNSSKIAIAQRNVEVKRLTAIDIGSLALSLVASILLAWHDPTPFALVQGNLIGAIAKLAASHLLLHGPRNRLAWDRGVARSVLSFGSKVMLSSIVTFMAGEGSRLLSANLVSVKLLALMGLASTLNLIAWRAIQQLSGRVLFPAYAEVLREDPGRLSRVLERTRLVQIVPALCVSVAFAFLGPFIVGVLYDQRYADTGLILQISAVGSITGILSGSYSGVLWAMNRVGLGTILLSIQVALQWSGMLLGDHLAGPLGVVVGNTVGIMLNYPVTAIAYGRLGLWHRRIDIPVLLLAAVVTTAVVMTADWSVAKAW
jgi:O-antigen/teichoic acid export membrane protein